MDKSFQTITGLIIGDWHCYIHVAVDQQCGLVSPRMVNFSANIKDKSCDWLSIEVVSLVCGTGTV